MDLDQILKLYAGQLEGGMQREKTFKDRLAERRSFVMGQEKGAAPVFEGLMGGSVNGVKFDLGDALNPLKGFTNENNRLVQYAEDDLTAETKANQGLLDTIASLADKKRGYALEEAKSGVKYNPTTGEYEAVSGDGVDVDETKKLVELREKMIAAGLDTKAIDKKLKAAGISASSSVPEGKKEILNVIDQLLGENTKPITGTVQLEAMIPGSRAQTTVNLYNQLQGLMALENREKLKGSGAISDFEFRTLQKAANALGRNLSDDEFKRVLTKLQQDLSGGEKDKKVDKKSDPLGIL